MADHEKDLIHPNPKIQENARVNYKNDPKTKQLVDAIFDGTEITEIEELEPRIEPQSTAGFLD